MECTAKSYYNMFFHLSCQSLKFSGITMDLFADSLINALFAWPASLGRRPWGILKHTRLIPTLREDKSQLIS